jgi:hypothetical protein
MLELASLRSEVGRLRQQSNEVAKELAEIRLNRGVNIAGGRRGGAAASGKRFIRNITMADFASFIAGVLQAPVADQTGLKGTYDIEMTPPRGGAVDARVERVTGILHNELGLQLIPFDGPFTASDQNYAKATGPNKAINIEVQPDGTFTASTNVLPGLSATNGGGFAIKLERSDAPGLKPASAELFPDEVVPGVIRLSPDFVAAGNAAPAEAQDRPAAIQNACINNLRLIDAAKGQWALEYHKQNSDTPTMEEIRPYVGRGFNSEVPVCPDGGVYTLGKVGEKPTCSIPGHVLP